MSLGCMVLYHDSITSLTKSFILRTLFPVEEIEIEVMDAATTVIYLWNVQKEQIWQATVCLESVNIMTVYGFADTKDAARTAALKHFSSSISLP